MEYDIGMRRGDKKDFVEACIKFYIKELKLEKSRYTLLVGTHTKYLQEEGFNGGVIQYGLKQLAIMLSGRLQLDQLAITIAHEMVHIKQFAKGRLGNYIDEKSKKMITTWLGKPMDLAYYNRPWEHEAWRQERELAYRLFDKTGIWSHKNNTSGAV